MHLILVSDELLIERGEFSLARDFAPGDAAPFGINTTPVKDNEIQNAPTLRVGEIQMVFTNCSVLRRRSGARYRVPMFRVETSLRSHQIVADTIQIPLGFVRFARVEVVDEKGYPLTREHVLGVASPGLSIEVNGPDNSPLYVLLPPGEHRAYLADARRLEVTFVIREHDDNPLDIKIQDSGRFES